MFGQQRQRVRIVVLHPNQPDAQMGVHVALGPGGGGVARMQITDHNLRFATLNVQQLRDGRLEALLGSQRAHVANVGRDES